MKRHQNTFYVRVWLVHSRFPNTADPIPADFKSASFDPEPTELRSPIVPKRMLADVIPPSTPDHEHSDFKHSSAATSKNSDTIARSPKITGSFYSQYYKCFTRKPPGRLNYGHS